MTLEIKISGYNPGTLDIMSQLFCKIPEDIEQLYLTLNFSTCRRVSPESLAAIIAFINYFRSIGIKVEIEVIPPNNLDVFDYASRLDFFNNLNIDYQEFFCRQKSDGRFVEITNFNIKNDVQVCNKIVKVVSRCNIDPEVLKVFNFALWEIMANVDQHSDSIINGYAVAQNFEKNDEILITIIDCGKGIQDGLKEAPNGLYKDISNPKALELCIQKGVTNGTGLGNGLFLSSEIIKLNKGNMFIFSKNNGIFINSFGTRIREIPYWKGTIITLTFKKNTIADYKSIFTANNLPESLDDGLEISLKEEDLW